MGDPIGVLRDPATIRLRCATVARAVGEGRSGWFTLARDRLPALAQRLARSTRERLAEAPATPTRFDRLAAAGGVGRAADLEARLADRAAPDAARARIDLAVLTALLGAAPGAAWRHRDQTGPIAAIALPVQRQRRDDLLAMLDQASGAPPADAPVTPSASAPPSDSAAPAAGAEGLTQATLRAFGEGVFSADAADPLRVDAGVLKRLDAAALRAVFQVGSANPLVGLEPRAELLRRFGERLEAQAAADGGAARPSRLFDTVAGAGAPAQVAAADLLRTTVTDWAGVWPGGSRVLGLAAGDVWPHPWAGADGPGGRDSATAGWVPLHHPGQRLVWALAAPLAAAGVRVTGLEALTGPPDARSGALLIDAGVIVARDPRDLARTWKPSDVFVVEWRALTVALTDELAAAVAAAVGADPHMAGPAAEALLPAALAAAASLDAAALPALAGDGSLF